MNSEPGKQKITIHILPNILRTNGTKFGQLIEYNKDIKYFFSEIMQGN